MSTDLNKLNRLRVNAGKKELKAWKASQEKLAEAITALETAGFTDALPGANVEAAPVTDDPEVAKNLAEPEKDEETPSLADSAMSKNIAKEEKKETKPAKKEKVSLARGLDTEPYARNCRERVRDHREAEKKANAKKPAKEEKKKPGKIVGEVDAKVDPEKAKRQKDKIKAKQEARAAKPAKDKDPNEITAADVARECGVDPKVARAKFRRHEDKLTKLHTKGQDRWTFPKSARAELVKILTGAK